MKKIIEQISLASKPESITEVESFIEKLYEKYDIGDDIYGNMLVSITEAVNNAIIHGNKKDESKQITITQCYTDDPLYILSIIVEDQGAGFDYNSLPDPTAPGNIDMIGGRGIFLIRHLVDYVIFNDKGNSIELQFKI